MNSWTTRRNGVGVSAIVIAVSLVLIGWIGWIGGPEWLPVWDKEVPTNGAVLPVHSSIPSSTSEENRQLQADVTLKLISDLFLQTRNLAISAEDGVVTIEGTVADLRLREHAVAVAGRVRGVRGVRDRLQVVTIAKPDEVLTDDVRAAFRLDAALEGENIQVAVDSGRVQLSGGVATHAQRTLAVGIAKGVKGVREVVDSLSLSEDVKQSPGQIREELRARLARDLWVDIRDLRIRVEGQRVFVVGRVPSLSQFERIRETAWVPGVREVDVSELWIDPSLQETSILPRSSPADDFQKEQAVREALELDPRVSVANIEVDVVDQTASLTGTVGSLQGIRAAVDRTLGTFGIQKVQSELNLQKRPEDSVIARQVRQLLKLDSGVDATLVRIHVSSGEVTLKGRVASWREKWAADDVASRIRGVTSVRNHIEPDSSNYFRNEQQADERIERRLKRAIAVDLMFDADDTVTVSVKEGRVVLSGVVDTWGERRQATHESFAAGAREVTNALDIRGSDETPTERFSEPPGAPDGVRIFSS